MSQESINLQQENSEITELRKLYANEQDWAKRANTGRQLDELEGNVFRSDVPGGSIDTLPAYAPGEREFEMLIDTGGAKSSEVITGRVGDNVMPFGPAFDLDRNPNARMEAQKIHAIAADMAQRIEVLGTPKKKLSV